MNNNDLLPTNPSLNSNSAYDDGHSRPYATAMSLAYHVLKKLNLTLKTLGLTTGITLFTANQFTSLILTNVELFGLRESIKQLGHEKEGGELIKLTAILITIGAISLSSASANSLMAINNYFKSAQEDLEHRQQTRGLKKKRVTSRLLSLFSYVNTFCREILQFGMTFAGYRYLNTLLAEAFPQQLQFLPKSFMTNTVLPLLAGGIGNFTYAKYITQRYNRYAMEEIALALQKQRLSDTCRAVCTLPNLFIFASSAILMLIYSFGYFLDLHEMDQQTQTPADKVLQTLKSFFYYLGFAAVLIAGLADAVISGIHLRAMPQVVKGLGCDFTTFSGLVLGVFSGLLGILAGPVGIYIALRNVNTVAAWVGAGVAAAFDLPAIAAFEMSNGLEIAKLLQAKIKQILCRYGYDAQGSEESDTEETSLITQLSP